MWPVTLLLFSALVNFALGTCPPGAIEGFTEKGLSACFLYERFPAQFITAERLCRDARGHLASITDLFINDFVAQGGTEAFEVMNTPNFWVGGNDLTKQGRWEWISGTKFAFENWADNEPKKDGRSFCIALSLPQGLWYSQSCYESKPYVCEVPALNVTTTPHSVPTRPNRHHSTTTLTSVRTCEDGWSYLNRTGLCYRLVKDTGDCYKPNTWEASVHSKEENRLVGLLAQREAGKKKSKNVKVRLALAQYHPKNGEVAAAETDSQSKPWLNPHNWALQSRAQRLKMFNELRKNKHPWTWFDGSDVDFTPWAKGQPKRVKDVFACAQFNTCYENDCKKGANEWSTADCIHPADFSICARNPS